MGLRRGSLLRFPSQIRFVENKFPLEWFPTIEDAYVKKCLVDGEEALLRILDTAGQDDCACDSLGYSFFLYPPVSD